MHLHGPEVVIFPCVTTGNAALQALLAGSDVSLKDSVQGDSMAAQADDLIAHLQKGSQRHQFAALVAPTPSLNLPDCALGLSLLLGDLAPDTHLTPNQPPSAALAPLGSTPTPASAQPCNCTSGGVLSSASCLPAVQFCHPDGMCQVLLLKNWRSFLNLPLTRCNFHLWK